MKQNRIQQSYLDKDRATSREGNKVLRTRLLVVLLCTLTITRRMRWRHFVIGAKLIESPVIECHVEKEQPHY